MQFIRNFFFEVINSALDIPLVSSVFKYLTGVELTYVSDDLWQILIHETLLNRLLNSSCFIMAIPYNIVYKVITGKAPSTEVTSQANEKLGADQSLFTPVDDANVARGVATVISGLWISITDLTITGTMATRPDWAKRTVM
jgi:hypothetical protein